MKLSDRMKLYEDPFDNTLPLNVPIIVRLDGYKFNSLSKKLDLAKVDNIIKHAMIDVGIDLWDFCQNVVYIYTYSDEINILMVPKKGSKPWLNNRINKINSLLSGLASVSFYNRVKQTLLTNSKFKSFLSLDIKPIFDCRTFVMPANDVTNYFIWRQIDCRYKTIRRVLHHHLSFQYKDVHNITKGKNINQLLGMLKDREIELNSQDLNGTMIKKTKAENSVTELMNTNQPYILIADNKTPDFIKQRDYLSI